jgi:hypothetical protein
MMAVLTAGIALGSATTSVVWANHQFDDVPTSNQFHGDITWANNHDIVDGFTDGGFHPAAPVSRQAFTAFLRRYNAELQVVHDIGTFNGTEHSNSVSCPAGTRVLSAGGSTSAVGFMLTDVILAPNVASVRWESDNNATVAGNSDVWALCAPTV